MLWDVVLEKILESPLDCKELKPINPKGNQSWIFIRRTDAEAVAPIPDGHLIWRVSSLEKTLMLGNIEGRWRSRRQRTRWLHGITDSMDMRLSKLLRWWRTGKPRALQPMGSWRLRNDWVTEMCIYIYIYIYTLIWKSKWSEIGSVMSDSLSSHGL